MGEIQPEEAQFLILYHEAFSTKGIHPEYIRRKLKANRWEYTNNKGRGRNPHLLQIHRVEQFRELMHRIHIRHHEIEKNGEVGSAPAIVRDLDWRARIPPSMMDASLDDPADVIARRALWLYADKLGSQDLSLNRSPPKNRAFSSHTIVVEHADPNRIVTILPGQTGVRVSFRNVNPKHAVPGFKGNTGFRIEFDSETEPIPMSFGASSVSTGLYFNRMGVQPLVEAQDLAARFILVFNENGKLVRVHEVSIAYLATAFEPDIAPSFADTVTEEMAQAIHALAAQGDASSSGSEEATSTGPATVKRRKTGASSRSQALTGPDLAWYFSYALYKKRMENAKIEPRITRLAEGDVVMSAFSICKLAMDALRVFGVQAGGPSAVKENAEHARISKELTRMVRIVSLSPWYRALSFIRLFYQAENPFGSEVSMCGLFLDEKRAILDYRPHEYSPVPFAQSGSIGRTPFANADENLLGNVHYMLAWKGATLVSQGKYRIRAAHIKEPSKGSLLKDIRALTTEEQINILTMQLNLDRADVEHLERWDRVFLIIEAASSLDAHKHLAPELAIGYYREKSGSAREDCEGHLRAEFSKRMAIETTKQMKMYRAQAERTRTLLDASLGPEMPATGSESLTLYEGEGDDAYEDDFVASLVRDMQQDSIQKDMGQTSQRKRMIHPAEEARRRQKYVAIEDISSASMKDRFAVEVDMRAYFNWLESVRTNSTVTARCKSVIVLKDGLPPEVRIVVEEVMQSRGAPKLSPVRVSKPVPVNVPVLQYCQTPRPGPPQTPAYARLQDEELLEGEEWDI